MTLEDLRVKLDARPFEPFRFRLPDGRALSVPHPEFVSVSPTQRSRTVLVWLPDGSAATSVDLSMVSDFEPLSASRKKKR